MPDGTKIPIVHILTPAIVQQDVNEVTEEEPNGQDSNKDQELEMQDAQDEQGSWTTPIIEYIQDGRIPDGENPRSFRLKVTPYS